MSSQSQTKRQHQPTSFQFQYPPDPRRVLDQLALTGAPGNGFPSTSYPGVNAKVPIVPPQQVRLRRISQSNYDGDRSDKWHTSSQIYTFKLIPGPSPNSLGGSNEIRIRCLDGSTTGLALTEALLGRGEINGGAFLYDIIAGGIAAGRFDVALNLSVCSITFEFLWPGLEHLSYNKEFDLFDSLTKDKVTLQKILLDIAREYRQIFKIVEDNRGSKPTIFRPGPYAVLIGDGPGEISFSQLRILSLYTHNKKVWMAEIGIVSKPV